MREKFAHYNLELEEVLIGITVQGNQGKADYQRALQQAATIRALAEAEAEAAMRDQIMQRLMAEPPKEAPAIPATVPTTPLTPTNGAS